MITELYEPFVTRTIEQFGIARAELLNGCRRREVVQARFALAYALRQRTDLSLAQIGRLLDGRDHTTIMYAVQQAEVRAVNDYDYALRLLAVME